MLSSINTHKNSCAAVAKTKGGLIVKQPGAKQSSWDGHHVPTSKVAGAFQDDTAQVWEMEEAWRASQPPVPSCSSLAHPGEQMNTRPTCLGT